MTNKFLTAALEYIDLGMSVVILGKHSKEPITAHTPNGLKDATRSKSTVTDWWTLTPKCNIGMVCGSRSGGIVVIDIDNKHGVDGYETMRDWETEHGDMPETVTCCTPTGGYHFYYRVNREIRPSTNDAIGVDIRGDDSYVVLPPSIHPDTKTEYVWENSPDEFEIAEADELVYQFIDYVRPTESNESENDSSNNDGVDASGEVKEGNRNNKLFKMACGLMAQSWDDDAIISAINTYNRMKCKPPYPQEKVDKLLKSALSKPKGKSEQWYAEHIDNPDGAKSKGKGSSGGGNPRFNHAKLANELIKENHACFIEGVPAVFINDRYEMGWDAINKAVIMKHDNASSTNRKEVREYIFLKAPHVQASPPNLIAFKNGVLDVLTMEFRDHFLPTDIIQNVIPHNWNPQAESRLVDETLRKLSAGDPIIELNLSEFMGLCMYRSGELAYFPILLGRKGKNASNGKSTYIKMIRSMLGKENYTSLSFNDLGEHFLKRYIAGKLANLGDDISSKKVDADALEVVKKAASGDRIFCDVKNGSGFEYESYCTFVFSANKMPSFESDDDGINRRMFPLRFNARFTRDDPDFNPKISKQLETEEACERMIVKAVQGLKRCIDNNGPTPNAESIEMLEDIKVSNNSILQWMRDVDRDADSFIGCQPTPLFESYREWCAKSGIQKPFGKPGFGKMLVELFAIESHVESLNGEKKRIYRYIEQ